QMINSLRGGAMGYVDPEGPASPRDRNRKRQVETDAPIAPDVPPTSALTRVPGKQYRMASPQSGVTPVGIAFMIPGCRTNDDGCVGVSRPSQEVFASSVDALTRRGYAVVLADSYTTRFTADDVRTVRRRAQIPDSADLKIALLGHSAAGNSSAGINTTLSAFQAADIRLSSLSLLDVYP